MANEVLNSLLKEYEQKKIKAEYEAEQRKEELYKKEPRLEKIESELNQFAISTAKKILNNSTYSYSDLQKKIENLRSEKKAIIQSLKLPENYLDPHYECPLCHDTGYIMNDDYKTSMCNCLKQRLLDVAFNNSNISNIEKENFDSFNDNIFSDEVDLSKYNFNISPRKNILNIKNKCIKFIENFDSPDQKNLLFIGNTGLR